MAMSDMYRDPDEVVLCGASGYEKKFYLNEQFDMLPQVIKDELKILCVYYTEDVGGVLEIFFDGEGNLDFRTSYDEDDFFYDEIGSILKVKQYREARREMFEELELFYKVRFLGMNLEEE